MFIVEKQSDEKTKAKEFAKSKEQPTQAKVRKWNCPLPKISVNVSCLSWAVAVVFSVTVAITFGFAVYTATNQSTNTTIPQTTATNSPPNITTGISDIERKVTRIIFQLIYLKLIYSFFIENHYQPTKF